MPYISKTQLRTLEKVREHLEMMHCSFGVIGEHVVRCDKNGAVWAGEKPAIATDYIRDRTRIWRKTWVLEPLDAILTDLNAKDRRS